MTRATGPTRDLRGKRFNRLLVLRLGERRDGRWHWVCRCDCGTEKEIYAGSLVAGLTLSCGCYKKEKTAERFTTHGHTKGRTSTRAYQSWAAMIQRTTDPNHVSTEQYAGRGITVCDRWRTFENFLADMGEPPKGTTLDRIDNDGDYEPSNCQWSTMYVQTRNTRRNRYITHDGKTMVIRDWARELGMPVSTITQRLNRGWPPERALVPVEKSSRRAG